MTIVLCVCVCVCLNKKNESQCIKEHKSTAQYSLEYGVQGLTIMWNNFLGTDFVNIISSYYFGCAN